MSLSDQMEQHLITRLVAREFKKDAAESKRLEAENKELRAALSAAIGFMLNAAIDLETGAPKKTALGTINGGIAKAREALTK
jgi:hypothetical protein